MMDRPLVLTTSLLSASMAEMIDARRRDAAARGTPLTEAEARRGVLEDLARGVGRAPQTERLTTR